MLALRARPLVSDRFPRLRIARPEVSRPREIALPTIAPGQIWLIETDPAGALLRPFETAAFAAANVVLYDRELADWLADALPLGTYAEPASSGEPGRSVRLALDGWSVVRLLAGRIDAARRSELLLRAAAELRTLGIDGDLSVHLLADARVRIDASETPLADLRRALADIDLESRVTAVFATQPAGGAAPPCAVLDNAPAG